MTKQQQILLTGLTDRQVAERRQQGLTNRTESQSSRTIADILRANVLTPFNALITALAVAVMLANRNPINSLFFAAMLLNIIVGVVQELKAKATLDRLAILVKPKATVIRNGRQQTIDSSAVVQDDLIVLTLGDQIVADGEVVETRGLEVNESLLTGEAEPINKDINDRVLSGSMVVAGNGIIRATKVGELSYAVQLTRRAKQFKRASSELIAATNTIMKWIARILIIVAPLLLIGQLRISGGNWGDALTHTVAAIIGMIPEGLVLLTSMAFLLAVVKLARQQVLVQQLPAVETLARVNTLLLDKTGTITTGQMKLKEIIDLTGDDAGRNNHAQNGQGSHNNSLSKEEIRCILATLASCNESPTNQALAAGLTKCETLKLEDEVPFSSSRKWSAIGTMIGNYILGAPEIVGKDGSAALKQANVLVGQGYRVLMLIRSPDWIKWETLPAQREPVALVVIAEQVRSDAAQTLRYFADQGVEIKIISGDSPRTVGAVARQVGLTAKSFDARNLPDANQQPAKFLQIVQSHNIFGRVKPEQKRQIAAVLQAAGDIVAMTGDGVNDALALKKADLGIAMNSGAAATKSVAEVVLMDNQFSHLPAVLGEGRRVVANIERVSNLFIIKNVYSLVLSLAVTVMGLTYPLMPSQMTIISALSIGIPAFFLALAPNKRRYQPGFLKRVLRFAIPMGIITAAVMLASYYLVYRHGMSLQVAGTFVSCVAMGIGVLVLVYLSRPVKGWKLALIVGCGLAFALFILWPPLAHTFGFQLMI